MPPDPHRGPPTTVTQNPVGNTATLKYHYTGKFIQSLHTTPVSTNQRIADVEKRIWGTGIFIQLNAAQYLLLSSSACDQSTLHMLPLQSITMGYITVVYTNSVVYIYIHNSFVNCSKHLQILLAKCVGSSEPFIGTL